MQKPDQEAPFPARVYGLVLGVSAAIALLLWWFTAHYNLPMPRP